MPTDGDMMRLDAIAKHLGLAATWDDPAFSDAVVSASIERVSPILRAENPRTGEEIAAILADHFSVRFEEVRSPADIDALEDRYLKHQGELGFGRLRTEINDPSVDALLFQRMKPSADANWIAVLNLQDSTARAYWNRFHELGHRIAEPSQPLLPFRRHRLEASNPVERLVDQVAAEIAFYPPVFDPQVRRLARNASLTFSTIYNLRDHFAPTCSILAAANAVVKRWPAAAIVAVATFKGRSRNPAKDRALRANVQARNANALEAGLFLYPNMRVPTGSPIMKAYRDACDAQGYEDLGCWTTSDGSVLPAMRVLTSAVSVKGGVYAVISAR